MKHFDRLLLIILFFLVSCSDDQMEFQADTLNVNYYSIDDIQFKGEFYFYAENPEIIRSGFYIDTVPDVDEKAAIFFASSNELYKYESVVILLNLKNLKANQTYYYKLFIELKNGTNYFGEVKVYNFYPDHKINRLSAEEISPGDTLKLYGTELSRNKDNYEIYLDDRKIDIVDIVDTTIYITIPTDLPYHQFFSFSAKSYWMETPFKKKLSRNQIELVSVINNNELFLNNAFGHLTYGSNRLYCVKEEKIAILTGQGKTQILVYDIASNTLIKSSEVPVSTNAVTLFGMHNNIIFILTRWEKFEYDLSNMQLISYGQDTIGEWITENLIIGESIYYIKNFSEQFGEDYEWQGYLYRYNFDNQKHNKIIRLPDKVDGFANKGLIRLNNTFGYIAQEFQTIYTLNTQTNSWEKYSSTDLPQDKFYKHLLVFNDQLFYFTKDPNSREFYNYKYNLAANSLMAFTEPEINPSNFFPANEYLENNRCRHFMTISSDNIQLYLFINFEED